MGRGGQAAMRRVLDLEAEAMNPPLRCEVAPHKPTTSIAEQHAEKRVRTPKRNGSGLQASTAKKPKPLPQRSAKWKKMD